MAQSFGESLHRRFERSPRLSFAAGAKVLVRFGWTGDGNAEELQAELLGVSHYEFLALRLPPTPGILRRLKAGTVATVRFLHEGVASVFQADVISHVSKPALLVFLSYPDALNTKVLRQHQRLPCAFPVLATTPVGEIAGLISDLSRGGCRLRLDLRGQSAVRQIKVGDSITLKAALSPEGGSNSVAGVLRSVSIEQFRLVAGLAFDTCDDRFEGVLDSFLISSRTLL